MVDIINQRTAAQRTSREHQQLFPFAGAGGQRLRAGGGLVGSGRGDVRDDVWPPAVLQPGPRETVRADPHGGDQVPTDAVSRRQVAAVGAAHQGPQQTVKRKGGCYWICSFCHVFKKVLLRKAFKAF